MPALLTHSCRLDAYHKYACTLTHPSCSYNLEKTWIDYTACIQVARGATGQI